MANMSYCRFENTLRDMQDCCEHMLDPTAKMDEHEQQARKQLLDLVVVMADAVHSMDADVLENGDPSSCDDDEDEE